MVFVACCLLDADCDTVAGVKQKNSVALKPEHQARLKAIIDDQGICQAARHLKPLCRHSIERAAQGSLIHAGTALLLEKMLTERDAAGKSP